MVNFRFENSSKIFKSVIGKNWRIWMRDDLRRSERRSLVVLRKIIDVFDCVLNLYWLVNLL